MSQDKKRCPLMRKRRHKKQNAARRQKRVREDRRRQEASAQGKLIRELIARFASDHLIGKKIKNGELRKNLIEPPWNPPKGYEVTEVSMEDFSMEWLTAAGAQSDFALLQLHGGGYVGSRRITLIRRRFLTQPRRFAGCAKKAIAGTGFLWRGIPPEAGWRLHW